MGNNACCADNRTSPQTEQVFEEPAPVKIELPKETLTLPPLSPEIDRVLTDRNPFRKQLEELQDPTVHKYKDEYFYGNLDEEGRPQGYGKMYKSDGSLFIGQFKNGVANGKGMFILPDGSYYEGQLQDNFAESTKGYFKSNKIQYQGGFRKNVFHGQGTEKGDSFEFTGEYVNGKRKNGTFSWGKGADAFSYVGSFDENGKFTGKGKLSDPKGVYQGDFINGIKQGYGVYRFKTEIRYEGYYKNNDKNGRGSIINKDGTIAFCGEFLNGLPHGKGYATDRKGKKHSIEWNEGVYADLV